MRLDSESPRATERVKYRGESWVSSALPSPLERLTPRAGVSEAQRRPVDDFNTAVAVSGETRDGEGGRESAWCLGGVTGAVKTS